MLKNKRLLLNLLGNTYNRPFHLMVVYLCTSTSSAAPGAKTTHHKAQCTSYLTIFTFQRRSPARLRTSLIWNGPSGLPCFLELVLQQPRNRRPSTSRRDPRTFENGPAQVLTKVKTASLASG